MPPITWHPELETGHAAIDLDHRTLLEALNRLQAAMEAGQGREEIGQVLGFLRDYTVSHFSTEEALMLRLQYPKASAHFAAHAELLVKVSDYMSQYRAGAEVSLPGLLGFLRAWLEGHIQVEDKAFGAYLGTRGPEARA